ncbi:hypothetical protein [Actinomadura harenae]|nr:hypothetical protein [Actinomadura harenae]
MLTAHLHEHAATVDLSDFDRPVWDANTILLGGPALTRPAADGATTLRKVAELITPALQEGAPTTQHAPGITWEDAARW